MANVENMEYFFILVVILHSIQVIFIRIGSAHPNIYAQFHHMIFQCVF